MNNFDFSIKNLIMAFFILIVTISLINILTIKYYKSKQEKDSALVDVSGRNRMLSQKIGFYAEMLVQGNQGAMEELAASIQLHDSSLHVLKVGGIAPGMANGLALPLADENIMPAIDRVERLWSSFKTNAEVILNNASNNNQGLEDPAIATAMKFIESNAGQMLFLNNQLVQEYVSLNKSKKTQLDVILLVILIINLTVMAMAYVLARKHILLPVKSISEGAEMIASGNLKEKLASHTDPYISNLVSSINLLRDNLYQSAQFAESIGNGEFNLVLENNGEDNVLYNQLSNMRDKLILIAEEDKKRNWATEGLAEFGEILRSNQNDIDQLCEAIISKFVKYLKVNQGGIFLINEEDPDEPYLNLKACYAWERKKYLNKKIMKGQGLVSQCWLEQDIIYMTEVPDNYINITSGLGGSVPKCVLIAPLKINEEVLGVVEIAGFEKLEEYQIEFVKKVSENIASSLSTAQVNSRTKLLLEESQVQTEEMRAQEEEIRQHMEEMQATQEEMERTRLTLDTTMQAIDSSTAVIEFDLSGNILMANELFLKSMKYKVDEINGKHHSIFVDRSYAQSEEYKEFWNDLRAGKSFSGEFLRKAKDGSDVWLMANYNPVLDGAGKILKIIKIAKDYTQEKLKNAYFEGQINAIRLSQGVAEFDMKGMIINANDIFLDLMGYELEEIKNKHHRIFCEKEYAMSKDYVSFWEKLNKGEFLKGEFMRLTKGGSEIWMDATYTPILDLNGKPMKVVKFANKVESKDRMMA